jgi:hypothetical protein
LHRALTLFSYCFRLLRAHAIQLDDQLQLTLVFPTPASVWFHKDIQLVVPMIEIQVSSR